MRELKTEKALESRDPNTCCPEDIAKALAFARPMIRRTAARLIGRAGIKRQDREDMEHDIIEDVLRRVRSFDATRANLNTFIRRVVEHRFTTILRDLRAQKRNHGRSPASLDVQTHDTDGRCVEHAQMVADGATCMRTGRWTSTAIEQSDLRSDVEIVMKRLPSGLRELWRLLPHNSVSRIARLPGMSRRKARRRVNELRDHLQKLGLGGS